MTELEPLRDDPPNAEPTVLVVDDDPALVELYSQWLTDRYHVRTAADGREALEAVDHSVDVVVLDRRMPDLTGAEVAARIRDRDLDVMIAMVTGIEPNEGLVDLPFNEYATKPVTRNDLLTVVESLVNRHHYSRAVRRCFRLASELSMREAAADTDATTDETVADLRTRLDSALNVADESVRTVIKTSGFHGLAIDMNGY